MTRKYKQKVQFRVNRNNLPTTTNLFLQVFTPSVSATCRAGVMTIKVKNPFWLKKKKQILKKVETGNRFLGVVHARDYRWKYKALLNRSHNIAISTFKKVTSSTSTRYYEFFGRRPACTSYGLGTEETLLNINMLADKKKDDYCGVFINEKSEERSVAFAVIILKKK